MVRTGGACAPGSPAELKGRRHSAPDSRVAGAVWAAGEIEGVVAVDLLVRERQPVVVVDQSRAGLVTTRPAPGYRCQATRCGDQKRW